MKPREMAAALIRRDHQTTETERGWSCTCGAASRGDSAGEFAAFNARKHRHAEARKLLKTLREVGR